MNYKLFTLLLALAIFCIPLGCSDNKSQDAPDDSSRKESSSQESTDKNIKALDTVGTENKSDYAKASQPEDQGWNINPESNMNSGIKNAVGESERKDFNYFDDAVFIGDSVTLKLKYYVTERRSIDPGFLGKAQFLCSGSLGSSNALWEVSEQSVHPLYNGEKNLIQDSVSKMGVKKIYIMLGVNDVAMYGVQDSVNNICKLIDEIIKKSPDVKIYVQSATPIVKGKELDKFNNSSIQLYNNVLSEICLDKGYNFIDVASVMKDDQGYLKPEYCSDPSGPSSLGIHFTPKACEIWVDYLLTHTK